MGLINKFTIMTSIVILLVLLLAYHMYVLHEIREGIICGMWQATDEFCEEADVDDIFIKINNTDGTYKMCMMTIIDEAVAHEETMEFNLSYTFTRPVLYCTIRLLDKSEVLPEEFNCDIYLADGYMSWTHEEKSYLRAIRLHDY